MILSIASTASIALTASAWQKLLIGAGFYRCPIYEYLHIKCPGCGTTHALAALLHGQLAEAFRWNELFVAVVLPLSIIYAAVCLWRTCRGEFRWPAIPRAATFAGLGVAVVFTIVRNL